MRLLAAFGSGFGLPLQLGLGCGYRSFFCHCKDSVCFCLCLKNERRSYTYDLATTPVRTQARGCLTTKKGPVVVGCF